MKYLFFLLTLVAMSCSGQTNRYTNDFKQADKAFDSLYQIGSIGKSSDTVFESSEGRMYKNDPKIQAFKTKLIIVDTLVSSFNWTYGTIHSTTLYWHHNVVEFQSKGLGDRAVNNLNGWLSAHPDNMSFQIIDIRKIENLYYVHYKELR